MMKKEKVCMGIRATLLMLLMCTFGFAKADKIPDVQGTVTMLKTDKTTVLAESKVSTDGIVAFLVTPTSNMQPYFWITYTVDNTTYYISAANSSTKTVTEAGIGYQVNAKAAASNTSFSYYMSSGSTYQFVLDTTDKTLRVGSYCDLSNVDKITFCGSNNRLNAVGDVKKSENGKYVAIFDHTAVTYSESQEVYFKWTVDNTTWYVKAANGDNSTTITTDTDVTKVTLTADGTLIPAAFTKTAPSKGTTERFQIALAAKGYYEFTFDPVNMTMSALRVDPSASIVGTLSLMSGENVVATAEADADGNFTFGNLTFDGEQSLTLQYAYNGTSFYVAPSSDAALTETGTSYQLGTEATAFTYTFESEKVYDLVVNATSKKVSCTSQIPEVQGIVGLYRTTATDPFATGEVGEDGNVVITYKPTSGETPYFYAKYTVNENTYVISAAKSGTQQVTAEGIGYQINTAAPNGTSLYCSLTANVTYTFVLDTTNETISVTPVYPIDQAETLYIKGNRNSINNVAGVSKSEDNTYVFFVDNTTGSADNKEIYFQYEVDGVTYYVRTADEENVTLSSDGTPLGAAFTLTAPASGSKARYAISFQAGGHYYITFDAANMTVSAVRQVDAEDAAASTELKTTEDSVLSVETERAEKAVTYKVALAEGATLEGDTATVNFSMPCEINGVQKYLVPSTTDAKASKPARVADGTDAVAAEKTTTTLTLGEACNVEYSTEDTAEYSVALMDKVNYAVVFDAENMTLTVSEDMPAVSGVVTLVGVAAEDVTAEANDGTYVFNVKGSELKENAKAFYFTYTDGTYTYYVENKSAVAETEALDDYDWAESTQSYTTLVENKEFTYDFDSAYNYTITYDVANNVVYVAKIQTGDWKLCVGGVSCVSEIDYSDTTKTVYQFVGVDCSSAITFYFTNDSQYVAADDASNTGFYAGTGDLVGYHYNSHTAVYDEAPEESTYFTYTLDQVGTDGDTKVCVQLIATTENGETSYMVVISDPGIETGVAEIGAEAAEVEYYNLQGVKVVEPTKGIFIRRQGNKAEKVLF